VIRRLRCSGARVALCVALLGAGCGKQVLKPNPHYVLGNPYRVGPVWHYPREAFDLDETGLAAVMKDSAPRLTTDGEMFDQTALAAAHPTIQLPAIALLTNLETGREVMVRLNDRGSGDPHRLLEITRRTAQLLAARPGGVIRVRLRVLSPESHAAADSLPGAPALDLAAAPRGPVEVAELPPVPGVRLGSLRPLVAAPLATRDPAPVKTPPLRLAEAITQTTPQPGRLVVRLDTFEDYQYAAVQRARMGWSVADIVSVFEGRTERFRVEIGPLPSVAAADAVLDKALAFGIPDARIVVD
jgi:rare lipoprotein A